MKQIGNIEARKIQCAERSRKSLVNIYQRARMMKARPFLHGITGTKKRDVGSFSYGLYSSRSPRKKLRCPIDTYRAQEILGGSRSGKPFVFTQAPLYIWVSAAVCVSRRDTYNTHTHICHGGGTNFDMNYLD